MNTPEQQPTAVQQVETLRSQFTNLMASKGELTGKINDIDKQIASIQSTMLGIGIGQKLNIEVEAENEALASENVRLESAREEQQTRDFHEKCAVKSSN